MKTTTTARTYRNIICELELPRTIHVSGEFPTAVYKTLEDNEENRKSDYEYCKRTYGKDCNVYQKDPSGKIIRENGRNIEEIENNLTAQGF